MCEKLLLCSVPLQLRFSRAHRRRILKGFQASSLESLALILQVDLFTYFQASLFPAALLVLWTRASHVRLTKLAPKTARNQWMGFAN